MHRLGLLVLVAVAGPACSDKYDPDPLDGTWRVERTAHNTTSGCSPLMLSPLMVGLHPGYEHEIDLGAQDSGDPGFITSTHVTFTSLESVDGEMLRIKHELEIQIHVDLLLGTASTQGVGTHVGCNWELDAVANHASR